jgi:hypothetical protein
MGEEEEEEEEDMAKTQNKKSFWRKLLRRA